MIEKKKALNIVGISVRTTNENQQAMKDIPMLWQRVMGEGIVEKVSNRIDDTYYCLYTDYESDHTAPYTVVLGVSVPNLDVIPEGMVGKAIPAATYERFVAKGDLTASAVGDAWLGIWNADLDRTYTTDMEVYGEKASNPKDGEVDIFIAVS